MKILKYIISLFAKSMPEKDKKAISIFIKIADNINAFIQSPFSDVIVKIIPGDKDALVLRWLKLNLPKYLSKAKELTGGEKALLVGNLTKDYFNTTLNDALINSQVVYRTLK